MRFQQYINEATEFTSEEIAKILRRDCKPFLKEKTSFWRGIEKRKTKDIEIFPSRQERRPKDTTKEVQKLLDRLFKKKFGWRPRSTGIFTLRYKVSVMEYGKPYLFFPIGRFKFLYSSQITDLYNRLYFALRIFSERTAFRDWVGKWYDTSFSLDLFKSGRIYPSAIYRPDQLEIEERKKYNKWLETEYKRTLLPEILNKKIIELYTSKNLSNAPKRGEVMFGCKFYYLVHESHKDIIKILNLS